jgi:plasmid stabilization system protein ParE
MRIRFQPEAEAELLEARAWYSLQRRGLDSEFMMRVDEALKRIIQAPEAYPTVYRHLRRAVVRQFPFAIFYEPTEGELRVVAVFHSRRNPKRLKSRV